ncbi:MAG: DUF86 domain-containing protein [Thermomicrobiales bacterium]|nr:DUF86 domain-containing protein [Thermomicrobiales bacterium]
MEKALINIGIDAWQIREHDAELYDKMPALQEAIALRNRLAHGYGEIINDEVIWRTITVYIPELLTEVNENLTHL